MSLGASPQKPLMTGASRALSQLELEPQGRKFPFWEQNPCSRTSENRRNANLSNGSKVTG